MAPLPRISAPVAIPPKSGKANNVPVTAEYLQSRAIRSIALGYGKPKYIQFCERALASGMRVQLYEARHTASKYVTLRAGGRQFKVRFSNHKPIPSREVGGDCDFFVGVTNLAVTTTDQAFAAAMSYFGQVL